MDKHIAIINENGEMWMKLKPISPRDKSFTEGLLQKLIFNEPTLLPVGEIDSDYSHLIPLGQEVSVRAGSIDVLFLTPEGRICIVETKLWRNPEAHRTVVAQIIDYAKALANMSFMDFCEAVTKTKGEESTNFLFKKIRKKHRDFDEIELQQNIQDSLSHGRFLLLIVGDRIYPEVALLAESIHSAPHLEFNLALAELSLYHLGKDSQLLVIPKVVGRTLEKTRAVVKIQYEEKKPEIEVTAFEIEPPKGKTNAKVFMSSMPRGFSDIFLPIYESWVRSKFVISWGTVGFTLRCKHGGKLKTILEAYPSYMSIFTEKWCRKKNLPTEICTKFQTAVKKIGAANRIISENRVYLYFRDVTIGEYGQLLSEIDNTARQIISSLENE